MARVSKGSKSLFNVGHHIKIEQTKMAVWKSSEIKNDKGRMRAGSR